MTSQRWLEVCVDSPAGLLSAVRGGADRVELCAALALSGLTPSPGMMRLAAAQPTPVYAMIRSRAGDFCFDAADFDAMRGDIDAARVAGLAGVVLGASHASGELDAEMLGRLLKHAEGLGATLHRAFDLAPDMEAALETAVAVGFERILTSGGAKTAMLGAERLRDLVAQADGRIAIMAGSGVSPANIPDLVRRTGVHEVHGSFKHRYSSNPRAAALGFAKAERDETDEAAVAVAVRALKG